MKKFKIEIIATQKEKTRFSPISHFIRGGCSFIEGLEGLSDECDYFRFSKPKIVEMRK